MKALKLTAFLASAAVVGVSIAAAAIALTGNPFASIAHGG